MTSQRTEPRSPHRDIRYTLFGFVRTGWRWLWDTWGLWLSVVLGMILVWLTVGHGWREMTVFAAGFVALVFVTAGPLGTCYLTYRVATRWRRAGLPHPPAPPPRHSLATLARLGAGLVTAAMVTAHWVGGYSWSSAPFTDRFSPWLVPALLPACWVGLELIAMRRIRQAKVARDRQALLGTVEQVVSAMRNGKSGVPSGQ